VMPTRVTSCEHNACRRRCGEKRWTAKRKERKEDEVREARAKGRSRWWFKWMHFRVNCRVPVKIRLDWIPQE